MTSIHRTPGAALVHLGLGLLLLGAVGCAGDSTPIPEAPAPPPPKAGGSGPGPDRLERFSDLGKSASSKMGSEDHAGAITDLKAQIALNPENASPYYNLACAYSLENQPEAALEQLARAIERGFTSPSYLSRDSDLDNIRETERFQALVERAAERDREYWEAQERAWGSITAGGPAFDSFESLDAHFQEQAQALRKRRSWDGTDAYKQKQRDLARDRVAALTRYVADHPDAEDREQAQVAVLYGYQMMAPYLESALAAVATRADAILAGSPPRNTAAEAALIKAAAPFEATFMRVKEEEMPALLARYQKSLEAVADAYAGTEHGGMALVKLMEAEFDYGARRDAAIKRFHRRLTEEYQDNETVQAYAQQMIAPILIKIGGAREFSVTDLDGKPLDLARFKGQVMLLDFWATWCGPCRQELPALKKVYQEYHDRGFEIVGFSLDYEDKLDKAAFRQWLADHEMPWPQYYDGKGWENEVARLYGVSAIPFVVLLDRKGNVADVNLRGEALEQAVKRLLG